MRFLAAWAGNPSEYWPQILVLILVIAVAVPLAKKIMAAKKSS
jgi:hypothetical protein